MTDIRLDGRTVLIADGSHRATRPRAEYFALLGARVVVNISPSQPNVSSSIRPGGFLMHH